MNKKILIMMGPSGCGKSTLEKNLLSKSADVYKAVSVTTRDIREGEVDGVDYHFISKDEFKELSNGGKLIQTTHFGDNDYGTTFAEYETEHKFVTLVAVPSSAYIFSLLLNTNYPDYDVNVIYFDISTQRLVHNMLSRGDTNDEIVHRLIKDDIQSQWKDVANKFDVEKSVIVTDDLLNHELPERMAKIFTI